MKKKILIPVGMAALFLCASWQEAETTVSPDRLFLADNGKSLFVTNRAGCELIKMSPDGQKIEKKVSFSSPVNAMTQDAMVNLGGMRRKLRYDVRIGGEETFGTIQNKKRSYSFRHFV